MKKKIIAGVLVLLLAVATYTGRFYIKDAWEFLFLPDTLIDKALSEPAGEIVTPKTTAELVALLGNAKAEAMPRIYIDRLPDDFNPNTVENKTLFMAVITGLALRANEKIAAERHALQVLEAKLKAGYAWSRKEMRFFNLMADKYDAQLQRTLESKIANLMKKVDTVPVSLIVNHAIYFTNWGKANKSAPFGQYYWADNTNYVLQPYNSLVDAMDSFVLELNSISILAGFHEARATIAPHADERHLAGPQLTHFIGDYMPEDTRYVSKLLKTYKTGIIAPLDLAKLAPVAEVK